MANAKVDPMLQPIAEGAIKTFMRKTDDDELTKFFTDMRDHVIPWILDGKD